MRGLHPLWLRPLQVWRMLSRVSHDYPRARTLHPLQRRYRFLRALMALSRHPGQPHWLELLATMYPMTQGHVPSLQAYTHWLSWQQPRWQRQDQQLLARQGGFKVAFVAVQPQAESLLRSQSYPHWQVVADTEMLSPEQWLLVLPAADQAVVPDPHWLLQLAACLQQHPQLQVIYTDDDQINAQGRRHAPRFKPDWNPDWFARQDYIGPCWAVRVSAVLPLLQEGVPVAQCLRGLFARGALPDGAVGHLPRVLLSYRQPPAVPCTPHPADCAPFLQSAPLPSVTVLIPSRDRLDLLRPCVQSILQQTRYPAYEILILDNQSAEPETLQWLAAMGQHPQVRVLAYDQPFNYAAINNFGVQQAAGDLVLLLNNDTAVINSDWLAAMVTLALQPGVGCVGAKLLYPDETIQHAGVVLGANGGSGHGMRHFPAAASGYCGRLQVAQTVTAVTGACLLLRKSLYQQVGGLNAQDLPVSWNDVDLCLKVQAAGYRNVWTPQAQLYHYESVSRGHDRSPQQRRRYAAETAYMRRVWGEQLWVDPFYNPNLSSGREDFSLNLYPGEPEQMRGLVVQ